MQVLATGTAPYRSSSTGTKPPGPGPRSEEEAMLELAPMKLPGKLNQFTGTVMYPNEDSAVWDVNRKGTPIEAHQNIHILPVYTCRACSREERQ